MKNKLTEKNYSPFDRHGIIEYVFHPRADYTTASETETMKPLLFEVAHDVSVGATIHYKNKTAPVVLFFHGNGEIVSDYDDLGPLFIKSGLNFLPVDYRGYGRSTGTPTISAMMNDSHTIYRQAKKWLLENSFTGPIILMGRSLGSAPAIEVATSYPDEIDALIIESGFAYIMPLIRLLGINVDYPGVNEENGPQNYKKIELYRGPTLIIHAQYDHIIPLSDGITLFQASRSESKRMLEIKGADHNNIFYKGMREYMDAINKIGMESATDKKT